MTSNYIPKLKVILLSNYIGPNGGGHAVNTYVLAKALQKNGVDVTLVTLHSKINSDLSKIKVKYVYGNGAFFSFNPSLLEAMLFSFFAFLWLKRNEDNFDLVHANGSSGFFYSLFGKKPLITHVRATRANYDFDLHTYPREKRSLKNYLNSTNAIFVYLLELLCSKLSELVFCNSRQCANALASESKIRINKIIPIPNGVDLNLFKYIENVHMQQKIITVARLSHGKYLERMIFLFSKLMLNVPLAKLCIVGSGDAESTIKEYAKAPSLHDAITFVGKVSHNDLSDFFKNQNIFIYGSMPGSTLNEALSCGVPFVVYVGKEKITTGSLIDEAAIYGCGFVASSSTDFIDKLYLMLTHPRVYYEMRKKCYSFSLNHLDINKIAKFVSNVYISLIKK